MVVVVGSGIGIGVGGGVDVIKIVKGTGAKGIYSVDDIYVVRRSI